MATELINPNPIIHERKSKAHRLDLPAVQSSEDAVEEFDATEIFDHIRDITDPEHPYSLEQLNVVSEEAISVDDKGSKIGEAENFPATNFSRGKAASMHIEAFPSLTVPLYRLALQDSFHPHRSALQHGHSNWALYTGETVTKPASKIQEIHKKLVDYRTISRDFEGIRVDINVAPGSHASEAAVNKQLNDKERVAAALENPHLVDMVEKCLATSEQ